MFSTSTCSSRGRRNRGTTFDSTVLAGTKAGTPTGWVWGARGNGGGAQKSKLPQSPQRIAPNVVHTYAVQFTQAHVAFYTPTNSLHQTEIERNATVHGRFATLKSKMDCYATKNLRKGSNYFHTTSSVSHLGLNASLSNPCIETQQRTGWLWQRRLDTTKTCEPIHSYTGDQASISTKTLRAPTNPTSHASVDPYLRDSGKICAPLKNKSCYHMIRT